MFQELLPWICLSLFILTLILLALWRCFQLKHDMQEEKDKGQNYKNLDRLINHQSSVVDDFTLVEIMKKYDIKYRPTK